MNARRNATLVALAPLMLALACQEARAADAADADAAEVSGVTVIAPRDDAYRAQSTTTATKTDTPLRDVPQAVTVITDELIRDQAMQTMADVVRYVPGVTMGLGEGHRDAPTIRGNATTADFFVDGVRDDVQYFRDLYNIERVEVLKGPNAMIFGRGGGGGVINRVTKKADWSDERSLTVELGSWDHRRLTADVAHPIDDAFAGRLVGLYERSESFRDFTNIERWGLNPSVGWRNGAGLTVSLSYEHFEDDRTTDRGAPSFAGRPSPASRGAFFGDPERSYATTNVDLVNMGVEYQVSDSLVVRNRTVYGDYDKFYANIFPGGVAMAGPTGAPATYPLQAYQNDSPRENLFNQTDVVWKTAVGGMQHTLLAGVEFGRQKTSNLRLTGHFNTVTGPTTLAGNPFADPTRRGLPIFFTNTGGDANNRVKATVAAAYVQDQIDLTPQLQLIAGLRFDSFDVDVFDRRASVTGRRDFSRQDDLWSPRLGLVFKPIEAVSLYASYSVSYLPSSGDQFSSLNATSETLEPEEFDNLEVGLKWEVTPELLFTAALYRLDRDNTTAPDPARPGQIVLTGSQRTEGFEAALAGRITERWEVVGGYAWQDAEITSTTSAAPAGRQVPLVPEHTFSLWNKYEITERFGAGLGIVHQTKMFASISNTVTLPGFTRVDAAVFVQVTDAVRAQVNVENLFDKRYFPTSHGDNNILPGAPRAVRVSLNASF
ncbi:MULTISPECIES: TonB-dependent siderophore receptor [unclassified Phenylobacterium]|uniref:TonB-dependent receptor n=1 Tax=unclassified Phenylobacterium TaxID=2640670 RepID=UPI00083B9858|nr:MULTISPECIES: TonB-dependent siderophore receptor [unclassified Phenylobacterium]